MRRYIPARRTSGNTSDLFGWRVARRFGLPPHRARLIAELASFGVGDKR